VDSTHLYLKEKSKKEEVKKKDEGKHNIYYRNETPRKQTAKAIKTT